MVMAKFNVVIFTSNFVTAKITKSRQYQSKGKQL